MGKFSKYTSKVLANVEFLLFFLLLGNSGFLHPGKLSCLRYLLHLELKMCWTRGAIPLWKYTELCGTLSGLGGIHLFVNIYHTRHRGLFSLSEKKKRENI